MGREYLEKLVAMMENELNGNDVGEMNSRHRQ
jgi:hypothetical protein